jgi:hypothetical protein
MTSMKTKVPERPSAISNTETTSAAISLADNRQQTITQQGLQNLADTSPQTVQQKSLANQFSQSTQTTTQRRQQQLIHQYQTPVQRKPNNTGLPDNLKSGIESLSGMSMDNVKVHYNSSKPAQLNAHAYAQGSDIHVAPGQEQHLPHEAWHVVQQAQGHVKPTMQMKESVPVNDDAGLEHEADVMGAKALQLKSDHNSDLQLVGATRNANALQLKADPYNIFTRVVEKVRDTGDEAEATAIIREASAEWDDSDKRTLLKYLPEKYHRLALAAGMQSLLANDNVEYEKGMLVTNGHVRKRMEAYKPFYQWLYEKGEEPTKMNCWETVLFAAFKVGKLSKENIQALINRTGGATLLASEVIANANGQLNKQNSKDNAHAPSDANYFIQDSELENVSIPIGKVVVFGLYGQHVALSAGGTAIYENDSDPGNLVKSTLAAAIGRNRREYGTHLSWGDLPTS